MNNLDFFAPLLVVVILVAAVILGGRTVRKTKEYDERQMILRAQGYRIGFSVTVLAGMAVLFLVEFGVVPIACATLAMYIALIAGVVTFAVFCIRKDVFFAMNQKGTYYIALTAFIVVADGAAAVSRIVNGSILENGVPTFTSCNSLILALVFLVILVALLIRKSVGERDE